MIGIRSLLSLSPFQSIFSLLSPLSESIVCYSGLTSITASLILCTFGGVTMGTFRSSSGLYPSVVATTQLLDGVFSRESDLRSPVLMVCDWCVSSWQVWGGTGYLKGSWFPNPSLVIPALCLSAIDSIKISIASKNNVLVLAFSSTFFDYHNVSY